MLPKHEYDYLIQSHESLTRKKCDSKQFSLVDNKQITLKHIDKQALSFHESMRQINVSITKVLEKMSVLCTNLALFNLHLIVTILS